MADAENNTHDGDGEELDDQLVVPMPSSMKSRIRIEAAREGISMSKFARRVFRESNAGSKAVPA